MLDGTALRDITAPDTGTILAAILAASPRPLTRILGDLCGRELSLRVVNAGERPLSVTEQHRLAAEPAAACRWRHGHLLAPGGLLAASVSLIWLPARLGGETNAAMDKGEEPAGVILGRLGMTRQDRRAMATGGMEPDVAVRSSAVLTVAGARVGIASELITREYADLLASAP